MAETGEVQLHFLDYWRVIRNRWGIILLTFLLVVVTSFITTYFLPKEYFSRVIIEVKSDDFGLSIFSTDKIHDTQDVRFTPTQLQVLQSKEILYPVIDELKLTDKWMIGGQKLPREQAFLKLKKMMTLNEVRNTNMLEIGITSTDPAEAASIANDIAVIYQKKRRDNQAQPIQQGLAELQEEVTKQEQKTEAANNEANKIRIRDDIVDTNPETIENVDLTQNREFLSVQQQVTEAQLKAEELKTQLAQIEKMKPSELINSLTLLNIDDPTVKKVLPLYQDAIAEEARLMNSGLGENHPRIKALRAQKEVFTTQLHDQIDALKKSLADRLSIAETSLDARKKSLDEVRSKQQKAKTMSMDYIVAKNNYIQQKKILDAAQSRLVTEKMQGNISIKPAEIWEQAESASAPSSPIVWVYMVIASIVGLICGVGLAFFLEYLDTSVKTMDDVEKFIGLPVLAVVPKIGGLLHRMEGHPPDAETYRTLRTNIEFHKTSPDANTIAIVSGGPGEGKSTTLCNLAFVCASAGSNVLIVDGDLRRPSQSKFLDVTNDVGLVNYANGEVEFEEIIRPTCVENISLIPSGAVPHDPVSVLHSHRIVELIAKAKAHFDLVLFDTPPILGLSDAAVLSSFTESTLMVVQHRRFPRSALLRVKQAVLNVGGNLVGVVLNMVNLRDDANYSYYTSYYDYYSDSSGHGKKRAEKTEVEI